MLRPWVYSVSSALLYICAFYLPNSLFWFSFLYLVPIFYAGIQQNISWWHGFFWGVTALGVHAAGVFYGMYHLAAGPWYVRIVPFILFMLVCGVLSAVWFGCAHGLSRGTLSIRLSVWVITAWVFQIVVEHYLLWPLGRCEGYLFFSPLLPLAEYPQLLWLLRFIPRSLVLLFLIACAGLCTYAVSTRGQRAWYGCIFALSIWVMGFLFSPSKPKPTWLTHYGCIQRMFVAQYATPALVGLYHACEEFREKKPELQVILCPESCIYDTDVPFQLQTYESYVPNMRVKLIVGGFYQEQENQRNTAYYIHQQQHRGQFHKRHAMPLTERMPALTDYSPLRQLYFTVRSEIVPSGNIRPLWALDDLLVCPYICSELFFYSQPDDAYQNCTILALCNDLWAPALVAQGMYLAARLRAIEWRRDIIYISYHYAAYINKYGTSHFLAFLK